MLRQTHAAVKISARGFHRNFADYGDRADVPLTLTFGFRRSPGQLLPLAFVLQRFAHLPELLLRGLVDAREPQVQRVERGDDARADHHAREPFVIGRHHDPGRVRARRVPDHVLIGRMVPRPQSTFRDVGHRELPVLRGLLEPVEKAFALLGSRDIEEEFQDHDALTREIMLDRSNVLVAFAPDAFGHELCGDFLLRQLLAMHAHDQAFLVVGAVEDTDAPALRQCDHGPPHEVVVELLVRWLLEGRDLAALRINSFEHALDRGVLAGRIHALEDQKQRPAVLRIELFLEIGQSFAVGFDDRLALALVEPAPLAGLVGDETKLARAVDAERRDERIKLGGERLQSLLAHKLTLLRHCERSEAIQSFTAEILWICFVAELVIGPRFARTRWLLAMTIIALLQIPFPETR